MSKKVTFSELVKAFAESHDLTQQKAEDMIRGVFDLVIDDLEENGKASITSFGSFELKDVAERTGINPQTKEEIVIPAHKKVSFKPFKALEESVNAPFAGLEPTLLGESSVTETEETTAKEEKEQEPEVFEDPFAEVIKPAEEQDDEAETPDAVEEGSVEEQEESEVEAPPVFVAPEKEKGNEVSWIFIVLVLLIAGTGIWFFFLRDSDPGNIDNVVAGNQAPAQQQAEQVEKVPPAETAAKEEKAPETSAASSEKKNNVKAEPEAKNEMPVPKKLTAYIIEKDEWMWDISREVYGVPYLWPLIFEANKTVNDDPNLVEPANTLMIPSLEGSSSNLTKADYAKLAKATKLVSEAYAKSGNSERAKEYSRFAAKYERNSKN
ncbi:MAG: HU family DNA-binding protein [Balneola sp.]|nr:HU family DNA-binding protein [Balneola sp.]MBO6651455.1 HU family DNA-binding protein [Balneola sp.]MBO6712508.1 HU family DNA-binding protein [Balneola sp.]MBO6800999.1 HU family DNA-binding protein [Balneola sp.]MBO6870671.1 HU family DNA-binding protein [Balneola sp.]